MTGIEHIIRTKDGNMLDKEKNKQIQNKQTNAAAIRLFKTICKYFLEKIKQL